jgi:hypothetical protein
MSITRPVSLLRRLSRFPWMRRAALAMTLALFVSAGLAHAAHLHKPESLQSGGHAIHCGLCIQLERSAAPPPSPDLQLAEAIWSRIPVARQPVPAAEFLAHPYEARGPPRAS